MSLFDFYQKPFVEWKGLWNLLARLIFRCLLRAPELLFSGWRRQADRAKRRNLDLCCIVAVESLLHPLLVFVPPVSRQLPSKYFHEFFLSKPVTSNSLWFSRQITQKSLITQWNQNKSCNLTENPISRVWQFFSWKCFGYFTSDLTEKIQFLEFDILFNFTSNFVYIWSNLTGENLIFE